MDLQVAIQQDFQPLPRQSAAVLVVEERGVQQLVVVFATRLAFELFLKGLNFALNDSEHI